jgi:hypothetical protein
VHDNKTSDSTHVKIPDIIPAVPMPEIARPIINTADVGAAPASNEPISKITSALMNTCFMEKTLYILPNMN